VGRSFSTAPAAFLRFALPEKSRKQPGVRHGRHGWHGKLQVFGHIAGIAAGQDQIFSQQAAGEDQRHGRETLRMSGENFWWFLGWKYMALKGRYLLRSSS